MQTEAPSGEAPIREDGLDDGASGALPTIGVVDVTPLRFPSITLQVLCESLVERDVSPSRVKRRKRRGTAISHFRSSTLEGNTSRRGAPCDTRSPDPVGMAVTIIALTLQAALLARPVTLTRLRAVETAPC